MALDDSEKQLLEQILILRGSTQNCRVTVTQVMTTVKLNYGNRPFLQDREYTLVGLSRAVKELAFCLNTLKLDQVIESNIISNRTNFVAR